MKTIRTRTLIALLFAFVCWLLPNSSLASVEIDGIYFSLYTSAKTAAVVSNPNHYSGRLTIPESISYDGDSYRVTYIGYSAFQGCTGLISIEIPSSVTSIGSSAFSVCSGLTSVEIPNSVTSIGGFAFSGCTGLTTIEIPNSVTSIGQKAFEGTAWYENQPDGLVYAGKNAYKYKGEMPQGTAIMLEEGTLSICDYTFSGCAGLTSVTIPSSVTNIGGCAFSDCTGLTTIEIPNSVTSIDNSAFSGCTGLASIEIPNSVTSIGLDAFNGCTSLTSIEIPNSVTSIGIDAFEGTAWYENQPDGLVYAGKNAYKYKGEMPQGTAIVLEEGTLSICGLAFYECWGLTSIEIPNSVTSFGASAFNGCWGLTSIEIPNSVTSISYRAFFECSALTSVVIPNSVTSIEESAFYGCWGLTSITAYGENPAQIAPSYLNPAFPVFGSVDKTNCILYVPVGCKSAYENAPGWSEFQNIVEFEPDTDISTLENAIYVNQVDGRIGGTMDIPVMLKNSYAVRGFQFKLELPEGTTINSWGLSSGRMPSGATESDKIATQKIDGNTIAIACSLNYGNATFTGNDGEIATVNVTFAENMEEGRYPIYLTGCDVTTADGVDEDLSDIKATLILEDYLPGDANGDGKVRIGDATAILNYIVGNVSNNFQVKAADTNGDGRIRIGDATAVLNLIVNQL